MPKPKKEATFDDLVVSREVVRNLTRLWGSHLTHLEFRAVLFVWDRTLGWGKEWECITIRQLTQGVTGENGEVYALPISSNRNRSNAAMLNLVEKGLLKSKPHRRAPRAKQYSINTNWIPEMKIPKRLRQDSKSNGCDTFKSNGCDTFKSNGCDTFKSNGCDTRKREKSKERENKKSRRFSAPPATEEKPAGSGREEILNAAKAVRRRSRAKQKQAASRGKALRQDGTGWQPTKAALDALWKGLHQQYHEKTPYAPLTRVVRQILWTYWRTWTEARNEGEFLDYLTWLFENWHALRAGSFNWMKEFPSAPVANVIVSAKLRTAFEHSYREKEKLKAWRKMEPHERKLQQLIIEKGLEPEKAQEIVDRQFDESTRIKDLKAAAKQIEYMKDDLKRKERAMATRKRKKRKKKLKPMKHNPDWQDI